MVEHVARRGPRNEHPHRPADAARPRGERQGARHRLWPRPEVDSRGAARIRDIFVTRRPRRERCRAIVMAQHQPEVAARAIVWAAHHRRREVMVGGSTMKAIPGNKVIPGLLDRYLARFGYDAQQTDKPADPRRPNNLWKPVATDHGAHGRFDSKSRSWSLQWWANTHRSLLGAMGIVAGLVLAGSKRTRKTVGPS